jgi:hypothetical protein
MSTIYNKRPELFLKPIKEQSIPNQPPSGLPKGKIIHL